MGIEIGIYAILVCALCWAIIRIDEYLEDSGIYAKIARAILSTNEDKDK